MCNVAESIRDMLWECLEATLHTGDPLDELRRAMPLAVGYLCRVEGRDAWPREENLVSCPRNIFAQTADLLQN